MKRMIPLAVGFSAIIGLSSCNSLAPVNNSPAANVEGLERQAPVTPDSNVIGNAINARNAVDYSQGRSGYRGYSHPGYYGY